MESKPVLHYFNVYARGEAIRLFLSHLKIDYEDKFCPSPLGSEEEKKQWAEIKDNYQFKTVPVLEIDGHKISQSRAIVRYLAAKHGHAPTDAYDVWRNESLIDHFADTENGLFKAFFAEDKEKAFQEFVTGKLSHTFTVLEKRLKENSSQEYLVGSKITAADVVWVNFFWSYWMNPSAKKQNLEFAEGFLKGFPILQAYANKRKGDFPRLETRKPSFI